MKQRSLSVLVTVILVVLLLIGTAGCAGVRSPGFSLNSHLSQLDAAMFVTKQAPAMVSLLVPPQRLEKLPATRDGIRQLESSVLATTELDYQQDIQPWLGDEMTFAVTTADVDRDTNNGLQPGYLLALSTRDSERARQFLQLFWQKQVPAGQGLVFEPYQGTKLIYALPAKIPEGHINPQTRKSRSRTEKIVTAEAETAPMLASAVVGDRFVLFANYPKVLRDAINNVQAPGLNLASTDAYQQAIKSLDQGQMGWAFLNLPQLGSWTQTEIANEGAASIANPLYDHLAIALRADQRGFVADTVFLAAPGQTIPASDATSSQVPQALEYLPATSTLAASGTNLDQFWKELTAGVQGYAPLAQLITQPVNAFKSRTGVDLVPEIFSWVQGEYALGLVPNPKRTQPDWIFITQRSPKAVEAIAHLDDLAQKQGYSLGALTLNNQKVSAWTQLTALADKTTPLSSSELQAEVRGLHTTVDEYEVFTTSVETMQAALDQATVGVLAKEKSFKQAIAPIAKPNEGYFYLKWGPNQALLEQTLPILKWLKLIGNPFSHLESLTVSNTSSEAGMRRSTVFFQFGAG
jgi:hypothetical protein